MKRIRITNCQGHSWVFNCSELQYHQACATNSIAKVEVLGDFAERPPTLEEAIKNIERQIFT